MIDVGKILRFFAKKWYLFLFAVGLALGVTYFYHKYQTPVYSLNTTLLIEDKTANILLPDGTTSIFNSKAIDNEIALLKSHSQIKMIIDQLDFSVSYFEQGDLQTVEIYKDSPFVVTFDEGVSQPREVPIKLSVVDNGHFRLASENQLFSGKKLHAFGKTIAGKGYNFRVDLKADSYSNDLQDQSFVFIIHSPSNLVNSYRNKLSMKLERGTSLLVIATSGTNIEKEKDFLNKLTEVYIKGNLERKNQISNNTIQFIEKQLAQIRQSLDDVESKLENFRKDNNLMQLTDKAVPILSRVNTLNKNKADQMLDLKYYNYLRDYLMTHDKFDDIVAPSTVGVSLPLFSDLLLKLSTLQIEKDGLMANSTYDNPMIKTMETEIFNQKQVLLENINNVISISEMKIDDFDKQIADKLSEFEKLPTLERHYLEINRLYKLNSEMYTYMLEKRSEVEIAKATNVPDLVQIDRAGDNGVRRISPDTRSNYMRSLIFALLIPAILLFLVQVSGKNVMEQEDLTGLTHLPIASEIPYLAAASKFPVREKPYSDFSVAIKKLGTAFKSQTGTEMRIIALTSSIFGEGKSFIAANLACSLALAGKKTLLVDFDFHNQGLSRMFPGADSAIHGTSSEVALPESIDSWVQTSDISNLDLLLPAVGEGETNESTIAALMNKIKSSSNTGYSYVIIDTPPVGLTAEVFELAEYVDSLLYLVRNKVTPKNILKTTLKTLAEHKQLTDIKLVFSSARSRIKTSSYEYYSLKKSRTSIGRLILLAKNYMF